MSPLNDVAPENISVMSCTRDTSHCDMLPLNNSVWKNMPVIRVTRDTSHFDMSLLKVPGTSALDMIVVYNGEKRPTIDAVFLTFHSAIGPYDVHEHSPSGDFRRHAITAFSMIP